MKKLFIFLFLTLILPLIGQAETPVSKPIDAVITRSGETAILSWKNSNNLMFSETIIFRSVIPIENYFSYAAVEGLCDKIYEGKEETYIDIGLAVNLPYYYIFFARDKSGNTSGAVVLEKKPATKEESAKTEETNTLAGVSSEIVNQVSLNEAGMIYNYNTELNIEPNENSKRLALFIIVKSPHSLEEKDKNAISYFIHTGTPTTILLGTGERAGVLNSYLSVFNKLPRNILEWQDIIKIANGRWPLERNAKSEDRAANIFFNSIYERKPNMDNPNDNAAVTVIAYGLRPAQRNMENEKKAIDIYRSIFGKNPAEALDWDLVRAIAYSGATR